MKNIFLSIFCLLTLNSCAIGSAVAAYSLMSVQSDGLSVSAEKDIVERVKKEIKNEESECTIVMHVTNGEDLLPLSK